MTYKDAPKLVQHPVRRRIETLQVLLRPANHLRKSLSGSTTRKAQASCSTEAFSRTWRLHDSPSPSCEGLRGMGIESMERSLLGSKFGM